MSIDELISRARKVCEVNRYMRDRFLESGEQSIFDAEAGLRCEKDAKVFEEIAGALEELKSYRASIFSGDMTKRMLKEEREKAISEFAEKVGDIFNKNSFRVYCGISDYDVLTLDGAMDAMLIVEAEMNNDESDVSDNNAKNKGWIPCSEKMPPVETEVFIIAKRKNKYGEVRYITTTAMYEDGTVLENDSCWRWEEIEGEWDEENDCYIIPEGWWENRHYNPDEVYNNAVDDEVIAWQPLPDQYIEQEEDHGQQA